ncbi:MAG: PadR family transcriptional regulator [Motilibacteraceae bacterium]
MSPVFGHGRLRLYLLKLLDEEPRHGYDVIRLLEDRFLGLYAPSAGTVYPRLARLEAEGLVTHEEAGGRKTYRLTDAGRAELAAHADDLAALERELTESVREMAAEVRADVRGSVRSLREELKTAARGVRREERAARSTRSPGRTDLRELDAALDRLATEARLLARRGDVPEAAVRAAVGVLERALAEVRKALT